MKKTTINLFLVDDHHVFREGLVALFDDDSQIEVVGEAGDGGEIIKNMEGKNVHVVLLDIQMPEVTGLEIIDTISQNYPQCQVLVFSMYENEEYIHQMMEKGASGYLLKSCRKEELLRAIKTVGSGDTYLSKEVSKKLIDYIRNDKKRSQKENDTPLTNREIEVLKLVATGITNNEIGKKLFISPRTVDTHRRNIMEKLNLHNAVALANYASKKGL